MDLSKVNYTFAVALCSMAQHAFAQQEAASEEQQQTEQQQQAEPETIELGFIDKLLAAFQDPSQDQDGVLIQFGVSVLCVCVAVYFAYTSMAKEEVKGFSLDGDEAPTQRKRAKARAKVTGAAKKEEERLSKVDSILNKANAKEAGLAEALYEDLDKEGPWVLDDYGVMDSESFIKLRRIVGIHQFRRFVARKEELLNERIAEYKKKNFVKYKQLIAQAGQEYQQLGMITTGEACEYIGMNENNYVMSFKDAETKKDVMERLKEDEQNTRLNAEAPRVGLFTNEQLKAMHMEKAQMEHEMEVKMSTVQVSNQREAVQLMMFERTKIMDELYIKHNVKMVDLMRAYKDLNLENDPDVKKQLETFQTAKKAKEQEIKKAMELTDNQKAAVKEVIEGSGGAIDSPLGVGGVLDYNNFMKIFSALIRLTLRFTAETNPAYKTERREHLAAGKEQKYAQCVAEYMKKQGITKGQILTELLTGFGVSMEIFQKSQQFYSTNPQHAEQFQKDCMSFEHAEHRDQSGFELSKEDALKYIERIEEAKTQSSASMAFALKLGKLGPQQAQAMQMIAKSKAFDELWKDTGVEEEDLTRAFGAYNLSEDEEFKKIITEKKQKMTELVQAEAKKMQEMMSKMGAGMKGMPGMPGMPGMKPPGKGPQGAGAAAPAQKDDVANMDF